MPLKPSLKRFRPVPSDDLAYVAERVQTAVEEALLDLAAQTEAALASAVPIGLAVPWLKGSGAPWTRTPALPGDGAWEELDGNRMQDSSSPYDGEAMTAPVSEALLYFLQRMVTVKMRVPNATPTTLRTYISAGGRKEILVRAAVTSKTAPTSASGTVISRIYRVGPGGTTEMTSGSLNMETITVDRVNSYTLKSAEADRTVAADEVCYATVTSDNADVNEGEDVYITTYWIPADIAPFVVKVKPRAP